MTDAQKPYLRTEDETPQTPKFLEQESICATLRLSNIPDFSRDNPWTCVYRKGSLLRWNGSDNEAHP